MPTTSTKKTCCICARNKITYICEGCSHHFCLDHLAEHRKNLGEQLDQIENDHNELQQAINDQRKNPTASSSIEQINQWEMDSINKIKQIAAQYRQKLTNYSNRCVIGIEKRLSDLAQQLKEMHQENEFTEIDINHFKERLSILKGEFSRPVNVSIEQRSTCFINKISFPILLQEDTQWKQSAITVAGGNGSGNRLDQLLCPSSIYLDEQNQIIYIADTDNHRVMEWKLNGASGRLVAGGHGKGHEINQLSLPLDMILDPYDNSLIIADFENRQVTRWSHQTCSREEIIISNIDCARLAMHKDGSLYVSDWKKNEVRRWKRGETRGELVAGGNGKGTALNQLSSPSFIFVDDYHTLYINDRDNYRVMKWRKDGKEGRIVAGGNGRGNHLAQLGYPRGIFVDSFGQIYIADGENHRVMRWREGAKEGVIVVGGSGQGSQANQLNFPVGLAFDSEGKLYVADSVNDRIQKFEIN